MKQSIDIENIEIEKYLPIIEKKAGCFYKKYSNTLRVLEYEDYISIGYETLCRCAKRGELEYFSSRLHYDIIDAIRKTYPYSFVYRKEQGENFYFKHLDIDELSEIIKGDSVIDIVSTIESKDLAAKLLKSLTQSEKTLIVMVFYDGVTLTYIAKKMGLSLSAISRRLTKILNKLRKEYVRLNKITI